MYDHSRKIGNKGDLIKHFALTVATKGMATGKDSFTYLDVHSGRSTYDLPDSGEWRSGIGKFLERYDQEKPLSEDLRYFTRVHSIGEIPDTRKYIGSSRIVLNVLKDVKVGKVYPMLCDTNPDVCLDLRNQFRDIPAVEIYCGDGYQKAHEMDDVDLVFIDPPDIKEHYPPLFNLIRHCVETGKPFVSWNPLHGNVPQQTMSTNCRSVADFAVNQDIPIVTVRWTKGWSGQMCGCQMLFSIPNGSQVTEACDSLIQLMEWTKNKV